MPFTDVIIIGSGLAALTAATRLAEDKYVKIITKDKATTCNSILAQGGIAAAISPTDTWQDHYEDTLQAGAFHNNTSHVKLMVKTGREYVEQFIHNGLSFDKDEKGTIHLGREGGHHKRRILHAGGDATGKCFIDFLHDKLLDSISIVEQEEAVELLIVNNRCVGVKTRTLNNSFSYHYAEHIVLASGGCGALYSFTSNAPTIVGDGLALAYRAGATLADLEFIQFHPTMLYVNGHVKGLISEAVRGEGAFLVNQAGKRIMQGIHKLEDLAPRDIVSQTIHQAILQGEKIYLNISKVKDFQERFPTIAKNCKHHGINLSDGLLPIVPGAHFLMGGVQTNSKGQTSVNKLYAIGEVAHTGVHGANRLASNSLLEGIVFANRLADYILQTPSSCKKSFMYIDEETTKPRDLSTLPSVDTIQNMMMKYVGITRSEQGLHQIIEWFESFHLSSIIHAKPEQHTKSEWQVINMITAGWLIATSALKRTESRGSHFREDYPKENNKAWRRHYIQRQRQEMLARILS
ncbi:L-aspartate oxidase [Bacillus sp. HMF5848]|uniref:L-aspartate oxidase n=1 Tax=Bacillus sp. HMF5848 TaxID=2495421 RepID=UPI000F7842AC|nr:L-aspartate oxidase [Bacillus sp. HMF5848]RSK25735.1 L-aspartate oxidase [Bacillus sp. HMF5848]